MKAALRVLVATALIAAPLAAMAKPVISARPRTTTIHSRAPQGRTHITHARH